MSDPALPPGFEEDPPLPPGFEPDAPAGPPAAVPYSSVPTLNPATGQVTRPAPPGQVASAKPTLTQQITALVETGMHLASAATGGVLGAIGGAAGAFAGSATHGGLQVQRDAQGRPSVPALDALSEGAKEGAQSLTYVPRSGLGLERSEQAARGLSELAPLGGLPGEVAALSTGARLAGQDLRTAGAAALDANSGFNASRAAATQAKAAKEAALEAPKQAGREAAREAGYVLTPTEAGAGKTARTTEGLAGEPRLAKAASEKNAAVTNALVRKDVQLPDDVPLSREALASKRREAGAAYAAIKDVGDIKNDAQYMAALDKIAEGYDTAAKSFPHRSENPFKKTLEGLKQETVSASSAIEEVKLLRNDADKAFRNGDKALGKAYRDAANALDDSMDRHLTRLAAADRSPELAGAVQKYRDARRLIAKTYVADKAINDTTGNVNAAVYARELKRGTKLDGDALTVAKFAQQFPRLAQPAEKVANTGATVHDVALGLLGKEALLMGARPLARKALLSETVQDRMVPKRKPQAAPPEPPLTAEQSPFPPQGGPEGPASPLGDLTPDWETAPGAAAPAGRTEVVPAEGLVPAVDEAPGPTRVLPGGADLRARSNASPAGPVGPGPVAEPPVPGRRAGEQIPAVPGRPDLPDTMAAEGPGGITPSAPDDPRAPNASYANRVQQGLEQPGGHAGEPIPVGEATELAPTDPRLAELEQLRAGAKSGTVKKALAAETAKLKRELKAQAETEKLKADVAELRQTASAVKDQKLKERLLARADELEKAEKIPVGEVTEGQPEIKPEKGERTTKPIPVGEAMEVPNEPATGRAPEMEKLPTGEAKHVADSGVEEAIPAGETRELFTPPEKGPAKVPEAEVRLEKGPRGQLEGFDKKGDPYHVKVSEQMLGADKKEKSILVEVHDPVTGQRRGFVDFAIRKDGVLVAENVKVAPYLKKRGLAELMYRAARGAKHDIAPGRVQTEEGLAMVEALQRKGIINKEADGPRAKTSDLTGAKDAAGQVNKQEGVQQERVQGNEGGKATEAGGGDRVQRPAGGEEKALPEGVTLRPMKSGGYEALNKQGNRIGHITKTGEVSVDKAFAGKGIVQALRDAVKKPKP